MLVIAEWKELTLEELGFGQWVLREEEGVVFVCVEGIFICVTCFEDLESSMIQVVSDWSSEREDERVLCNILYIYLQRILIVLEIVLLGRPRV